MPSRRDGPYNFILSITLWNESHMSSTLNLLDHPLPWPRPIPCTIKNKNYRTDFVIHRSAKISQYSVPKKFVKGGHGVPIV